MVISNTTYEFLYNPYIRSAIVFVLFFIGAKLFVFICEKYIKTLTKKTKTNIDDLLLKKTRNPISIILMLIGLRLAIFILKLRESLSNAVETVISTLISLVVVYLIMVEVDIFIDSWGRRWAERTKSTLDDQILAIFHRLSKIIISIIGLLFILTLWGIKIGPLLASLGIAGVAVAFALQSTLGNIFGGMSLLVDKSVKVGDFIKLDQDTQGEVIDVGLRSTKIKSPDNQVFIVPNGKLADSKILNYVLPNPSVRITIDFSVEYGSNVDNVKKVILGEIKKLNILNEPAPEVLFLEMGEFALKFRALFWIKSYKDRFEVRDKATTMFYNALNKAKIKIPFPTRTIYTKKRKE